MGIGWSLDDDWGVKSGFSFCREGSWWNFVTLKTRLTLLMVFLSTGGFLVFLVCLGILEVGLEVGLDDILEELYIVKESTIRLYKSFTNEMLMREGIMPSGNITVLGIGFAIAGHNIHHIGVLKERYYGLLS